MDTSKQSPVTSFEETLLKAKVAQICDSVGYHAISQDSSNILVDIYQRTIHHLARHCKDAANSNRRVEPTVIDLVQAYDFVGISIPELVEHIETVKLPMLDVVEQEEQGPNNRIQRNLLDDQEDGENKASSEFEEEDKPSVPLLKNTYEEIANNFPDVPVTASKNIRLGNRIVLVAPVPPSTSGTKVGKKKKKKNSELEPPVSEVLVDAKPPAKGKGQARKKRAFAELETAATETPIAVKLPSKSKTQARKKRASAESDPVLPDDSSDTKTPTKIKSQAKKRRTSSELEPVVSDVPVDIKPLTKGKGQGVKRRSSPESEPIIPEAPLDIKPPTKGKGQVKKKLKTVITPLDPSIAEPPSFFPILDIKTEEPESAPKVPLITPTPTHTPTPPSSVKQNKGKKKKRAKEQFRIVTETVSAADAEKEWFCPACGGPDDGDVMVECDSCKEWYHLNCTNLKKAPEDDENWACDICFNRAKASQKKPPTPVEVIKTKTPEPAAVHVPTPPPPVAASSSTQDIGDRCPECNLPDDGTMMIQCDDPFCAKWFHGKCVDLLEEPKEDESWFCKVCVDKQQSAFKRRRRAK